MDSKSNTITSLLAKAANGDLRARDLLYRTLYIQLNRVARNQLARAGTLSLDAPALLHDTYLRIETANRRSRFPNRRAFFTYASTVMRTVIVDFVRERQAQKRGSGAERITLRTGLDQIAMNHDHLIALNDAMTSLERVEPRCHKVVELRYFGGLTEDEIAEVLEISVPTVRRDWFKARAFLFEHLNDPV